MEGHGGGRTEWDSRAENWNDGEAYVPSSDLLHIELSTQLVSFSICDGNEFP